MPKTSPQRDGFHPAASWEVLQLRAKLLRRIRDFFDERGFLEVETPLLSADTVVDRHLDPFRVDIGGGNGAADSASQPRWLQTSPEFAMKRLLASGAEAIYQITRAFRQGELGPLHNPEFTIVEWYRVGDNMASGIDLLGELAVKLLECPPPRLVTYRDVFLEHVSLDPLTAETAELEQAARSRLPAVPESFALDDRDGWLDLLLSECIQPRLGRGRPVVVCDYPVSQAALAMVRPTDPPVAARFELFAEGLELANGYLELLDAAVLRDRMKSANQWRVRDGKAMLPETNRLLAAMEAGLPRCVGVALGFDRVVMLRAGESEIRRVMAFPFDIA
ncbi:EF-P lysine aminoacylase EpmA [Thermopirellula anaerolimosa]